MMRTDTKVSKKGCSGSTGTVVLLSSSASPPSSGKVDSVDVAWVGDSRAVALMASGEVVALTKDHKASRPDEMKRVRAAVGTVDRKGRLNKVLAVSRGFGDMQQKKLLLPLKEGEARRAAQLSSALLSDPDTYSSSGENVPVVVIAAKVLVHFFRVKLFANALELWHP